MPTSDDVTPTEDVPTGDHPPIGDQVATDHQRRRLHNIIGWVRIAKETLPAISEGEIGADRVAQMSALLDRLHAAALLRGDPAAPARLHRAA